MKRCFDIVASCLLLLLLSPVILILMILVRMNLGAPIFFTQVRPGRGGRPFKMVKFRSMTDRRAKNGELLPASERLTSFGRILRSSSLDELPELWNVLRGEMSLVGPRPLLMEYLELYTREQMRRHDVLPGVTGLAQVNGRNNLSWEQKFELDIWYVENQTLILDLQILMRTILKVIKRDGINAGNDALMPRFTGNSRPNTSTMKTPGMHND